MESSVDGATLVWTLEAMDCALGAVPLVAVQNMVGCILTRRQTTSNSGADNLKLCMDRL